MSEDTYRFPLRGWSATPYEISAKAQEIADLVADASPMEKRRYSITRALNFLAGDRQVDAGFEFELSEQIAARLGATPQPGSLFVPTSLNPRASGLDTKTNAAGRYTVMTEVRDLIELLRAKTRVLQLGGTLLSGVQNNISFPRQLTGTVGQWMAENSGSDVAQSDATFGQLSLTPKTYMATTSYSRQFLNQSTVDVENFVRNDLATTHALAIDLAAINGLGTGNQPTGLLQTAGIGSVAMGANGAAPTYEAILDLETAIADANADEAGMAFLTTPVMRGKLKKTTLLGNTLGLPIWESTPGQPGVGSVAGYPAYASKQVPQLLVKGTSSDCHAIIFGYWPSLVVAEWGVLELVVDQFTKKRQGIIEVTSFQMCDVGVRQPSQFSAIVDARNI